MGIAKSLRKAMPGITDALDMYERNQKEQAVRDERKQFIDRYRAATSGTVKTGGYPGADAGEMVSSLHAPKNPAPLSINTMPSMFGGDQQGQDSVFDLPKFFEPPQQQLGGNAMEFPNMRSGVPVADIAGKLQRVKSVLEPKPAVVRPKQWSDMSMDEMVELSGLAGSDPISRNMMQSGFDLMREKERRSTPSFQVVNQENGAVDIVEIPGFDAMMRGDKPRVIGGKEGQQKNTAKEQWVVRNGTPVYSVFREGDLPYEAPKSTEGGKQWIQRKGKVLFDTPVDGDLPHDRSKPEEGNVTDAEKAIQKLTEENQSIGKMITLLDAGAYTKANNEPVKKGSPEYLLLKRNFKKQLFTNDGELERLNKKIGGTFKRTSREAISLNEYRSQYPNETKDYSDNELKEYIEKNGGEVIE